MDHKSRASDHHFDVTEKGFKYLTPTREALQILTSRLGPKELETEGIPVSVALHRVLADDLISPVDVPDFNRAAMDGYAVRAEDTYGASLSSPISLEVVRERNGEGALVVSKGQAAPVVTGGQMPSGADAVLMVEYARVSEDGMVEISNEVHPAENVSRIGEDMRKGTLVLKAGQILLPQDIGLLTALGCGKVKVKRRLKVAVLSTGSEIRENHSAEPGNVVDVDRPMLINAVREVGGDPVDMGIGEDEPDAIRTKLKQALAVADLVLVTAGTSVGPRDFVPQVINELGTPGMLVHGVAMRPSMPTGLGIVDGKPVISLPGYPVSAYLAFIEFIPPLMDHMLGTKILPRPTAKAKLVRRIAGILGSRTYIRVRVIERDGTVYAEPVSVSGAGILSSLVKSNGLLIVPENVEGYEEGEVVDVELFRPVEVEDARF